MPRTRIWAWTVASALLMGTLATSQPGTATGTPRVPSETLGLNVQSVRFHWARGQATLDAWQLHLPVIADGGVDVIREEVAWYQVEPSAPGPAGSHTYVWDSDPAGPDVPNYDLWTRTRAQAGLRGEAVLSGSPSWARLPGCRSHTCQPSPQRYDDYAAFTAAFAARYGRNGTFWSENTDIPYLPVTTYEIWNEPNLPPWQPGCPLHRPGLDLGPKQYADLFVRAAHAIRAVDPDATILHGGLGGRVMNSANRGAWCTAEEWVRGLELLAPEVFTVADGIAYHVYRGNGLKDTGDAGAWKVAQAVADFRALLRTETSGGDLPLWINESGWTTSPQTDAVYAPESVREDWLPLVADLLVRSDCNVRSFMPHTWITPEQDPAAREQWFGIADPVTAVPKPSGEAYLHKVRQLYGLATPEPGQDDVVDLC